MIGDRLNVFNYELYRGKYLKLLLPNNKYIKWS